ncbi:DUF4169 family protein [Novosphingobium sp. 9U]|uniref:DUF4169 family protein n=1 Tax=Novosphingobium sp. 9U TaxID=2653158 RepID=UPI00135917E0|nr:DUF4169 family protein [Novosphingobium sp. 9U]
MAEIVNLRQARKTKQRADAAAEADANRARHGASKAQRRLARDEAERLARSVDGARREPD